MESIDVRINETGCGLLSLRYMNPLNWEQRFSANLSGTDYYVGDIHGEYDKLMASLEEIGFDREVDRLFSVGDLIDRGPKSLECLALLDEPWFHAVAGNHESLMAEMVNNGGINARHWLINGGDWITKVNPQRQSIDVAHSLCRKYVERMPLAMSILQSDGRRIGVIHADVGSHGEHEWGVFMPEADMWSRSRFGGRGNPDSCGEVKGIDAVVVGHCIVDRPQVHKNVINIDGGAFAGGDLIIMSGEEVLSRTERMLDSDKSLYVGVVQGV